MLRHQHKRLCALLQEAHDLISGRVAGPIAKRNLLPRIRDALLWHTESELRDSLRKTG